MRVRTLTDLGLQIRDFRHRRGLTQAQLADIVGVNRRWVVQVEQAKTSADLRTVLRALRALGAELHVEPRRVSPAAREISEMVDARARPRK